jgi:hypothetical protein
MDTKQFDISDLDEINSWYEARNMRPIDIKQLPQFGYIVPGIACGFLVQTDSANAFLEGFATNRYAKNYQKADAIDLICKQLLQVAKELGYTHVFAMTTHPNIVAACRDNEFLEIGKYTTFFREI